MLFVFFSENPNFFFVLGATPRDNYKAYKDSYHQRFTNMKHFLHLFHYLLLISLKLKWTNGTVKPQYINRNYVMKCVTLAHILQIRIHGYSNVWRLYCIKIKNLNHRHAEAIKVDQGKGVK